MRKVDFDSFLLCRRVASTEMGRDAAFQSQKQNGSQLALHASSCQEQSTCGRQHRCHMKMKSPDRLPALKQYYGGVGSTNCVLRSLM